MPNLEDMTPEQRDECVGKWVKVTPRASSPSTTPFLAILSSTDANAYWGKGGNVDRAGHVTSAYFCDMELQDQYARAWNPDGTPVTQR